MLIEKYRYSEEEAFGDIMYISDFYGLDCPQYLTVVNNPKTGECENIIIREEGWYLLQFCMGVKLYVPDHVGTRVVDPGEQNYLEAISANCNGREVVVPNPLGGKKRIRIITNIVNRRR